MAEKYDRLDRMRADIQKDKDKVTELLDRIKLKEARLKEAEASQIVADVGALNMTPEQLGEFLELIKSGKLSAVMGGSMPAGMGSGNAAGNTAGSTAVNLTYGSCSHSGTGEDESDEDIEMLSDDDADISNDEDTEDIEDEYK